MSDIVDKAKAQAELDGLSLNAKRYLADTLGNPIHAARLALDLSRFESAAISLNQLVRRIADIKLFTD